jgi:hypothetical protein
MQPGTLIFLIAVAVFATPSHAAFVITFPTNAPVHSSTGGHAFDVVLVNDGNFPLGPFNLDAFNIQVAVPVNSGVRFTGVSNATAAPYAFAGNSLGIVANISAGGSQIDWNDLSAFPPVVVGPGQTLGLGHVFYDVLSTAPNGSVSVTVNPITTFSEFPTFTAIPYTTGNGTLTVITPAPPTAYVLIAAAGLGFLRRFRQS